MSTKDIQIVRKLKASKGKMRQEAELVGAKASIPKQDVTGVCIYCDAGLLELMALQSLRE